MNTIISGWVEDKFQEAIKRRVEGRVNNKPKIDVVAEFVPLFNSQLFPITRSMFTSRLRKREAQ